MRIPAPCGICFAERQKADPNGKTPIVFSRGRVADEGYILLKCAKGHETVVFYDERKHDLLFRSACHALIDGYEREAVSSFAAALERVYEFFMRVVYRHSQVPSEGIEMTWRIMAKQSERQFGGFLVFYALLTGTAFPLDGKMIEFRNKVIHQGYIPDENEADSFGAYVFNQKRALTKILSDNCPKALEEEVKAEMDEMKQSAPKGIPQMGLKATLVNVDRGTNTASEITDFQTYILGLRENLKK